MIGIDLKPELTEMVKLIGDRNSYSGNKISDSIMKMFTELYLKIKKWMRKRNMFKSKTDEGQTNEAKRMTWYLNHYGNKQFNRGNPIFMDIYTTVRRQTIEDINKKFSNQISKITMDIL
jgi:hypothetical protein